MRHSLYKSFGKRALDVLVALPLLALAAPLLAVIAAVVRWRLGAPVLFRQRRIGWLGKEFTILKFRTMKDARDHDGQPFSDADRLTALGRFLRSTSLDELPELWNVLRGDMSLVGPRPLLPEYLPYYTQEQARRHEVRPGITGLAQVNGRNQLDWKRRFQTDVHYVDRVGFLLDLKILFKTMAAVASRSGVSAEGHATMPRFTGTDRLSLDGDDIVVLGAGGHAKVVIATLHAAGRKVAAVYDDDSRQWGETVLGVSVRGPLKQAQADGARRAIIAIGDNETRRRVADFLHLDWQTAVHPAAAVHGSVQLAPGSVVFAGAVIQPDTQIHSHAIINTGATIDHDCVVEAFASIGPGAHLAGNVRIGCQAAIGTGACVIPGVAIGEWTTVGAGTVVIADLPADVVAVGSPARIVQNRLTAKAA